MVCATCDRRRLPTLAPLASRQIDALQNECQIHGGKLPGRAGELALPGDLVPPRFKPFRPDAVSSPLKVQEPDLIGGLVEKDVNVAIKRILVHERAHEERQAGERSAQIRRFGTRQ